MHKCKRNNPACPSEIMSRAPNLINLSNHRPFQVAFTEYDR